MSRRAIGTAALPTQSKIVRHRELIGAVAVIGFFLGILVLAILGQARIAHLAAPAQQGKAQVTVQPSPTSAIPSAQPTASAAPPEPPRPPVGPTATEHTAVAGETLAGIAVRYQVPFEQIAADNGITDPNRIRAGQHLVLRPAAPGVQVIAPGATLSGYAQQRERGVADLLALNPQLSDPDRIVAGAGLRVAAS